MAPRKKAPTTPEGDTDSDSGPRHSTAMPPILSHVGSKIEKHRTKRSQVRKEIKQDYEKRLSNIEERIAKYFEAEKAARIEAETERLERLSQAIEKRAACEDGIFRVMDLLKRETEKVNKYMAFVYAGRQKFTAVKFPTGRT